MVEMLEYVKGLNIDPIKESDMLWIAEEAFNTPLPGAAAGAMMARMAVCRRNCNSRNNVSACPNLTFGLTVRAPANL